MREADERERREAVLADIARRVAEDGPRVARAHLDRAAQFMPFAALRGYGEMARGMESSPEPRRMVTEDRALELSRAVASLRKGDVVRAVFYGDGGYEEAVGCVTEVSEALRLVRVVRRAIPFDDLWSVEMEGPSRGRSPGLR